MQNLKIKEPKKLNSAFTYHMDKYDELGELPKELTPAFSYGTEDAEQESKKLQLAFNHMDKMEEGIKPAFSYMIEHAENSGDDKRLPLMPAFTYKKETNPEVGDIKQNGTETEENTLPAAFNYVDDTRVIEIISEQVNEVLKENLQLQKKLEIEKTVVKKESVGDFMVQKNVLLGQNFSLELIKKVDEINESEEDVEKAAFYVFQLLYEGKKTEIKVSAKNLYDSKWLTDRMDGLLLFESVRNERSFKKLINQMLNEKYRFIKKNIYYEKSGWKKFSNGCWGYVYSGGIVGKKDSYISGGRNHHIEIDESLVGSFKGFREFYGMQGIFKDIRIARVFMTFSAMSVLTTLFANAGFPIKFVLGVLGTTNTMKTSTSLVFTKFFNATKVTNPEISFMSTEGGVEELVSKYPDSILLIDDFMPAENKAKQALLNNKLELLVRLFGDRTIKKRMTKFSGVVAEYPPSGCCVFTGEHLTGVESSRTRILVLKLIKGGVNKDILSYYQQHPLVLSSFLYSLIAYVSKDVAGTINYISQKAEEYRRLGCYSVARLNETQALLFAMVDILERFWISQGFIKCEECVATEWKNSIAEIIAENDNQLKHNSVPELVLSALIEKIVGTPGMLKDLENVGESDANTVYEDAEFLYVRAEDLYLYIREFCKKFEQDFYITKQIMIERLKESEVLDVYEEKRDGKVIQIASRKLKQGSGNKKRYLYIRKSKIQEILQNNDNV